MNKLINNINYDWKNILQKFDYTDIDTELNLEIIIYKNEIKIFPPNELIFNCFNFFNFNDTKIVLLAQDPYINIGEAMGLCFSVPDTFNKIPPSLINIKKEIVNDLNIKLSKSGDLTNWAKQGILLLNTSLTVRQYKSNSHKKIWEKYTNNIIKTISDNLDNIVFILWGNNAKSKEILIDEKKHLILKAHHPSPLSANKGGFFGCKHFSKCNEYLLKNKKNIIDWKI